MITIINTIFIIWAIYWLFSLMMRPIVRMIKKIGAVNLARDTMQKSGKPISLQEDSCYIAWIDNQLESVRVLRMLSDKFALLQLMRTGSARTYDVTKIVLIEQWPGKMWLENGRINWEIQREVKQKAKLMRIRSDGHKIEN
jgi:hypothetical protein